MDTDNKALPTSISLGENYYAFPYNLTTYEQGWAFWQDGFSREELQQIVELGEAGELVEAKVGGEVVDTHIRDSTISWIHPTPQSSWLYKKLSVICRDINKEFFGFDINGVLSFQYTVYNASNGPKFYDWHVDRMGKGNGFNIPRKLSLTLQLSDPQEYEGGEIWLNGLYKICAPKQQGHVIAFPATTLHRVTPITAGVRKSLVAWYTGPDFR